MSIIRDKGMSIREQILEELCDNEEIIFVEGFDNAIIGVVHDELVVVYSFTKAIDVLREKLWMSEEEAIEHLHLHIMLRSEKKTPIWVMDYYDSKG